MSRGKETDGSAIGDDLSVTAVLELLANDHCRAILTATSGTALTAPELTSRFSIPLSTTYRLVNELEEAGLLEERLRLRPDGHHVSEYEAVVEGIDLHIDDGEITVRSRAGD